MQKITSTKINEGKEEGPKTGRKDRSKQALIDGRINRSKEGFVEGRIGHSIAGIIGHLIAGRIGCSFAGRIGRLIAGRSKVWKDQPISRRKHKMIARRIE